MEAPPRWCDGVAVAVPEGDWFVQGVTPVGGETAYQALALRLLCMEWVASDETGPLGPFSAQPSRMP